MDTRGRGGAGLYGLAFHAAAVSVALWTAPTNQADPPELWWNVVPPLLEEGDRAA